MDAFGEEVEKIIERELRPGFSKDMMLSLPLLAAEREDYILPPPALQAPALDGGQQTDRQQSGDALAPMEEIGEKIIQ
jgi:hypothetical protein